MSTTKVFLSYHGSDYLQAERLVKALQGYASELEIFVSP
jgi:hypothetical protein